MSDKIVRLDDFRAHVISEVICVRCGRRWIAERPEGTLLKDLECPDCGAGYVIETGEILGNLLKEGDYGEV